MSKVDFDDYVGKYDALLHERTRFFSADEAYFAQYKVAVARELVKGEVARILEYGCGTGRNIPFLKAAFPSAKIAGSDISAKSLDLARQLNPDVELWCEQDDPAPREFDLVFVAGVYHHVAPAERVLLSQRLYAHLRARGQLIAFEHNPFNPITRRIVSSCPYDADAVLLRPAELRRHLMSAGFAVDRQGYSLFLPPSLGRLASLERHLRWLPLGGQYWMSAKRH